VAAYCTADDLYAYGLPRGSLPNPARLLAGVDASANTLLLDGHGFGADVPVTFRAESGGNLPAPLTAGTTYYASGAGDGAFRVSLTEGGAAVDITTTGSRVLVVQQLPTAAAIGWASAIIDDMLPAHAVPLAPPYPAIVVMTAAELAVGKLLSLTGRASESLAPAVDAAQTRIARWARGIPLRGDGVDGQVATNRAAASSVSVPYADRRGWHRSDGWLP